MAVGETIGLINAFGGGSGGGGSSGGGVLVVHDVHYALDKTWQEIHDAGFCVLAFDDMAETRFIPISSIGTHIHPADWYVFFGTTEDGRNYLATSADGYPSLSTGGGIA